MVVVELVFIGVVRQREVQLQEEEVDLLSLTVKLVVVEAEYLKILLY
jgi:hypothetical protein